MKRLNTHGNRIQSTFNPNSGNFVVEFERAFSGEMVFLNYLGQPVLNATLTNETRKEIVLNQPSGIYIYNIHSNSDTFTGKIIIQ